MKETNLNFTAQKSFAEGKQTKITLFPFYHFENAPKSVNCEKFYFTI
ncbi:hypothetical protein BPO_1106 [Bergeyella porcorum]|uniref:Uncharacterized protein n=1 Tax=Bergeyella porcorum TaxID=1735111 RepID=A0AAU0F4P5_9FLAO